jgi:dimeric dUTPase (all-alpha-NTP-PPase superfamily)
MILNLPASKISVDNILMQPAYLNLKILPAGYKKLATEYVTQHINWLMSIDDTDNLVSAWNDVLQFMNSEDQSHLLREFFKINDLQDQHRNENFETVFPEYINLRKYVVNG